MQATSDGTGLVNSRRPGSEGQCEAHEAPRIVTCRDSDECVVMFLCLRIAQWASKVRARCFGGESNKGGPQFNVAESRSMAGIG